VAVDLELEDVRRVRGGLVGVSANLTPPAFIRPPVRTCDLITVGPPIRSAACLASSAVLQKPYSVTGIPARSTIRRLSYS
jgi:hypothetical protein